MSIFNPEKWAQEQFQQAKFGDKRRTERLIDITGRMAGKRGKSIAFSCNGDGALLEGAYRFIRNNNISPDVIRAAGFAHTVTQAHDFSEILALEDTTSLSYKHQVSSKLGKLGKVTDKARGWWVHSTLLLDSKTTRTIGLIHQDWWFRPDNIADADEKESGKWPDSSYFARQRLGDLMPRVISVCDREADILSYLVDKQSHNERFVVRGKHLRRLEGSSLNLLEYLQEQPSLGCYSLEIPQKWLKKVNGKKVNRAARKAQIEVKTATVTFANKSAIESVNIVLAKEINNNKENEPLHWLLITSEPVDRLQDALKVIRIYSARWRVEDFHKAWKTGAGAERQLMTDPRNLERAVSILAFLGVRLVQLRESLTLSVYLRKQGLMDEADAIENESCACVLEEDEWRLLHQIHPMNNLKTSEVPTIV